MQTGKDYRKNQRESVRQWQRNYPLDQYQQEYRQANPEYVKRNREQQKERNKKIKTLKNIEKFVNQKKSDLEKCNMNSTRIYQMNPFSIQTFGKIVKMDSLIVELTDCQRVINLDLLPVINCKNGLDKFTIPSASVS